MTNRSTVTNLVCLTQSLCEVVDKGGQMDVIYADFSKAFDSINHDILLQKLSSFGFSLKLMNLISSYLSNRSNFVFFNGFESDNYVSTSGVPQRSNLGPLLFNLFINELLTSVNCSTLAYADDIKLFCPIYNIEDSARLQSNWDHLVCWSDFNRLKLNFDKCYVVSYTKKNILFKPIT
ncbi:hypothetical protein Zmor_004085 [Zophobas morio]|uniref:Reverse transcriptase domain-containing protein n=1 Tax=Zophobas morio TaxID=2755281 RepID=A0AA38M203_9CUCU|nr:hypothetical protein Zmor_004085 [Zophobas morio]